MDQDSQQDVPMDTSSPTSPKSSFPPPKQESTPEQPLDSIVDVNLPDASPETTNIDDPTLGTDVTMSRHRPSPPPPGQSSSRGRGRGSSASSPSQSRHAAIMTAEGPSDTRALSQNSKDQLIQSLRTHRVNTITELRRIEKIFAYLDSAEVTEPMTSAWAHYVNSNNLLNELRGLTRNYPFSSECLDEAKSLVVRDPSSVRSWNYCWLVLVKMDRENLVTKHARALASRSSTWGGKRPSQADYDRLVNACVSEWTAALRQMLRHWDKPPSTTGH